MTQLVCHNDTMIKEQQRGAEMQSTTQEHYPELFEFCETTWFLGRITKQEFEDCKESPTFAACVAIELGRDDLVPA